MKGVGLAGTGPDIGRNDKRELARFVRAEQTTKRQTGPKTTKRTMRAATPMAARPITHTAATLLNYCGGVVVVVVVDVCSRSGVVVVVVVSFSFFTFL